MDYEAFFTGQHRCPGAIVCIARRDHEEWKGGVEFAMLFRQIVTHNFLGPGFNVANAKT